MSNQLEQLKSMTTVVVDSGDVDSIAQFAPQDATTNPSLVLQAIRLERYQGLLAQAVAWARANRPPEQQLEGATAKLAVILGTEILKHVPGRVSTEVDARLSFDTDATLAKARELVAMYQEAGVPRERILIKIASTWEGIAAARVLESEGVQCNLTLLFAMCQAQACAEAGVYLISPFVGRILDWHKAKTPDADFAGAKDPGVISVSQIYDFYKRSGFATVVMGASFRNIGEIQSLAGCDRLTIAPALLDQLAAQTGPLARKLHAEQAAQARPAALTESAFRWQLNQDAMATEKLAEGIRNFAIDQEKLDLIVNASLAA
ncbi:transaldolase [Massilia sp. PAMC28688]|uniref:transaldolase n=1 Tax=Massilia sp. PAMC28688 TaxID=2861283 RepID=UPI001C6338CE|nr:transaldolase [Massilia sp. PAMC28688]QYF92655.1 transaldolase [Massilia sp. PAMC28688]